MVGGFLFLHFLKSRIMILLVTVQDLYGNHVLFCHLAVKQSGFRLWGCGYSVTPSRLLLPCSPPHTTPLPRGLMGGKTGSFWLFLEMDWTGGMGMRCLFFPSFPQWNVSCFILQGIPGSPKGWSPEVSRGPAL